MTPILNIVGLSRISERAIGGLRSNGVRIASKHCLKIRHDPTPPQGGKELKNMNLTKLKEYSVKILMLGRLSVINIQSEQWDFLY